ncbi:uncharacterized protein LOC127776924 [Oryza glaberrima]|uniref:uncharacterized protein LOC127776924 n=1 Tax=Oryza glaberrima TaxID=4538 RepID=UPI00224C0715|nr:uncharacterized protein LOC127776924 [Oryza glaberrima]
MVLDMEIESLGTQAHWLHEWYLEEAKKGVGMFGAYYTNVDFHHPNNTCFVDFKELFQLYQRRELDICLLQLWSLHCSYQVRSMNHKIAFLDPTIVNFDKQCTSEAEIDRYLFDALVKLNGCDHILLPYLSHYWYIVTMCIHHWILLVINIDDSSICIYDSLRGIDKYQTILSALNRAYKKYRRSGRSYGRCKIDATEFRIFEHKYILRQLEATDLCGFYVMRYMLYFVEDGYNHRNAEKLGLDTSEILPHVFKALTDEFCGFIRHHVVDPTGEYNINKARLRLKLTGMLSPSNISFALYSRI